MPGRPACAGIVSKDWQVGIGACSLFHTGDAAARTRTMHKILLIQEQTNRQGAIGLRNIQTGKQKDRQTGIRESK